VKGRADAEGDSTTAHYSLHQDRAWSRNVDEQGFVVHLPVFHTAHYSAILGPER